MKSNKSFLLKVKGIITLSLVVIIGISCSEQEDVQLQPQIIDQPSVSGGSSNCNTPNPSLGPNAPQNCYWSGSAVNKGTLDCRTTSNGGYSENASWGIYKIEGGTTRYPNTKTRVERFFRSFTHGRDKKSKLNGTLQIQGLSDGNTCIIQSHATGEILKGLKKGQTNRSAQFLVYARKSGNRIALDLHITNNPYVVGGTGGRTIVSNWKYLNYGQSYTFKYETGYTDQSSPTQFSLIRVGGTEYTINHSHTTERVYSRYGAYGTSDTGDKTARIHFKNINYCEEF